jgi:hypothetical protein
MTNFNDETLMAFADGELDEKGAAAVRDALQSDAGLRDRLRRMQDVDTLLRASFSAAPGSEDRFLALLKEEPESTDSQKDNVIPLRARKSGLREWIPTGTGIAAALLVLVAGSVVTTGQLTWLEQVDDGLALTGPVQEAILSTPSGKQLVRDGLSITPVVSFESGDGRLCREMQVHRDELSARILACRDKEENEWCIEAFARMPATRYPASYYTAGVHKDPVIEAAYTRLRMKTTLSADAERRAIATAWVRK